jgi:type IV pilus assembly protein PilV
MAADPFSNRRPHPAARQRGMTLIEVLVSILLISFGIVGLLGILATTVANSTDAENRNRAAMIANQLTSQMIVNTTVTGCASATPTDVVCNNLVANVANPTAGGQPNPNYLPNGAVAFGATTTNSTLITVTWTTPGTKFSTAATSPVATYITQVLLP